MTDRAEALQRIRDNIERHGFHIYLVAQDHCPRFAYTIGLLDTLGHELVLAGSIIYSRDQVLEILWAARRALSTGMASAVAHDSLGTFRLERCHASWTAQLLLGALDYHQTDEVPALQLVADADHWTLDIPQMQRPFDPQQEPVWRWLTEAWTHPVPTTSEVATDLNALRGQTITVASRWEDDYWEMFTVPVEEVQEENTRIVPVGWLLSADATLLPALSLRPGDSLYRDARDAPWERASEGTP